MRTPLRARTSLLLVCATLFLSSCSKAPQHDAISDSAACPETPCVQSAPPEEMVPDLKNVILLIGDGMGPQQIGLLELYARHADDPRYPERVSHIGRMMRDGTTGMVISTPVDGLVNDSAAAATQLGSGVDTTFGATGLDAHGEPVTTALHKAQLQGMRTGLVSDTRLSHATMAAFASHTEDRWDETDIVSQMLLAQPDVMLSGGWRYFLPQGVANDDALKATLVETYELPPESLVSVRKDPRNLLDEAAEAGYSVLTHPAALDDAETLPVLGLFAPNGMQSGTQWWAERESESPAQPALKTMTSKALQLLDAAGDGFFLMVEGGQIDWAGHNNEAQRLLYEMIRFDEAVGEVLDWANQRTDTVVILTADHETGGFALHYDRSGPPDAQVFHALDQSPNYVSWATKNHTHTPVLATAFGDRNYTLRFGGLYHQSQLGQMMLELIENVENSSTNAEQRDGQ